MTAEPSHELVWLCGAAVSRTGVSCCGVTMVTHGGQSVTAYATDDRAHAVENLQHTLGEGPGVAASSSGAAVLVPDLTDLQDPNVARWPTFARDTTDVGIRAAFAFPLLLGTSSIGAFSLYRTEPGGLTSEGVTQGRVTADAVALSLAEPGEPAPREPQHLDPMRVHQAAGMVMVQLDLPIDRALLHMRATAYAEGKTVDELADTILDRSRRLSKEET
ncbi:MAG: GAF and ANTAR domain-containing protein [Marmoricola sp.]